MRWEFGLVLLTAAAGMAFGVTLAWLEADSESQAASSIAKTYRQEPSPFRGVMGGQR